MDPSNPNFSTPQGSNRNRPRVTTPQSSDNPFRLDTSTMPYTQSPLFSPPQFTYTGLLQQGFIPANYQLPPFSPRMVPPIQLETPTSQTPTSQIPTSQIPTSEHSPENAAEDSYEPEDFVPETQPENISEKKKQFGKRSKPKGWTMEERVNLAKAYVDVSEDPVRGNSQRNESFWGRVLDNFHERMGVGSYRGPHQIPSQFKDIQKKVNKFNDIYINIVNTRASGKSDADILKMAHFRYREENNGLAFTLEECWEVLKNHVKWGVVNTPQSQGTPSSRPTKRSKTSRSKNYTTDSSDARQINLNDNPDPEVAATIREPVRPIGRDKGKKAASSTSTGPASDDRFQGLLSQISSLKTETMDSVNYRKEKLGMRKKELELREKQQQLDATQQQIEQEARLEADYNFFISSHDHLTGSALKAALDRKERIRQKYNW